MEKKGEQTVRINQFSDVNSDGVLIRDGAPVIYLRGNRVALTYCAAFAAAARSSIALAHGPWPWLIRATPNPAKRLDIGDTLTDQDIDRQRRFFAQPRDQAAS